MPINCFDVVSPKAVREAYANGAYCPIDGDNAPNERERRNGSVVVLWQTHHGLCLFDREYNGRDDSDFYMTVWNPELGQPEEICFASTRGWTYPAYGSKPDATPETLAAYAAWREAKAAAHERATRASKAKELRRLHREDLAIVRAHGANIRKLRELRRMGMENRGARAMKLLTTNLRSEFRMSLRNQLIDWLRTPVGMRTPFSPKQWNYV